MQHTKVLEYIKSYADHFGVTSKIRLRHEVLRVTQAEDYDYAGRWDVVVKDLNGNVERQETFDAVLVASGHNGFPNVPTFKGLEKFKGKIVHTHSLKVPDQFKDWRVAVVGIGNSGIDAAVDASRVAAEPKLRVAGANQTPAIGHAISPAPLYHSAAPLVVRAARARRVFRLLRARCRTYTVATASHLFGIVSRCKYR
ncbi:hypothetical protein HPB47_005729 [Ixodes persulcatus]|uniref:Uncharacterized protein n=1 Tax=Ixodes persulcatus TaxID=34615 RepID=A0AC60PDF1_IXOPE|nr:hypothetical protein HPB47_005729 [Ixodes persulcatus]